MQTQAASFVLFGLVVWVGVCFVFYVFWFWLVFLGGGGDLWEGLFWGFGGVVLFCWLGFFDFCFVLVFWLGFFIADVDFCASADA